MSSGAREPVAIAWIVSAESEVEGQATIAAALQRKRPDPETFVRFLAQAHVSGAEVDWSPLAAGGRHVDLPALAGREPR